MKQLLRIEKSIQTWGADALVIQYTPYLYGSDRRGLCPEIPYWIRGLKKRIGIPVLLTAHELHYPLGFSLDRLGVGAPQFVQFLTLAWLVDSIAFTYEAPWLHYQGMTKRTGLFRSTPFEWIPVGSTIPKSEMTLKMESKGSLLLQFGSSHASRLFDFSFLALEKAHSSCSQPVSLAFLGVSDQEVQQRLQWSKFQNLRTHVQGLGYLAPNETSSWIQRADLILAPFVDGISCRRTSAMAALAHARPLVTTLGTSTDPSIHWPEFSACSQAKDPEAFALQVVNLLKTPQHAKELGEKGKKKYDDFFSWPVIAEKTLRWVQTSIQSNRGQT